MAQEILNKENVDIKKLRAELREAKYNLNRITSYILQIGMKHLIEHFDYNTRAVADFVAYRCRIKNEVEISNIEHEFKEYKELKKCELDFWDGSVFFNWYSKKARG